MSNIAVGNGGRGGAATAITVVQILMASPAILTTDAFAAPISNKDCKTLSFVHWNRLLIRRKQVTQ